MNNVNAAGGSDRELIKGPECFKIQKENDIINYSDKG